MEELVIWQDELLAWRSERAGIRSWLLLRPWRELG
jgi:hypothetical protein